VVLARKAWDFLTVAGGLGGRRVALAVPLECAAGGPGWEEPCAVSESGGGGTTCEDDSDSDFRP